MLAFMSYGKSSNPPSEIPKQIFGTFLDELKKGGASEDVLQRLHKVLLEDTNLTENAIRGAIFPDSQNS
jgi:hypothetical protein